MNWNLLKTRQTKRLLTQRSSGRRSSFRPEFDWLEERVMLAADTWTGGAGNGNWSTVGNWTTTNVGGIPVAGDDLLFPTTATGNFTNIDDLGANFSIHSIMISGSTGTTNYTINTNGVSTIQLAAGLTDSATIGGTDTFNIPLVLSGTQNILVNGTDALTIGAASPAIDLAGQALTIAGVVAVNNAITDSAGGGTLAFTGPGTLTLAGTNTYTGATTVSGGTVDVAGTIAGATSLTGGTVDVTGSITGQVSVSGTGILGGNGTVGGIALSAGGTVNPGLTSAIDQLNANANSTFTGGTFEVDVNGAPPGDNLTQTGTTTINLGTNVTALQVQAIANPTPGATYTIINTGANNLSGTFSNANNLVTDNLGNTYQITYNDAAGTVTLTAPQTLDWISNDGTLGSQTSWNNANNWAVDVAGSPTATHATPESGDVLIFKDMNVVLGGSFLPNNDISGLLGLTIQISESASATSDFTLGETNGDDIGLAAAGITSSVSRVGGHTATVAMNLILSSVSTAFTDSSIVGDSLTVSGDQQAGTKAISGSGGINVNGTGTVIFSGTTANSYQGGTTVTAGTLDLDKSNNIVSIPATNPSAPPDLTIQSGATVDDQASGQFAAGVNVDDAGTLQLDNGMSDTIGALSGAGMVILGNASSTLKVASSANSTFAGTFTSGVGILTEAGTAAGNTLTLSNANAGTLTTINVTSGTLAVSGGIAASGTNVTGGTLNVTGTVTSPIAVSGTGILGGNGGTVGAITNSGMINPSLGSATNIATLNSTASPNLTAGTFTVNVGSGTNSDQLALGANAVTLGGTLLVNSIGTGTTSATILTGTITSGTMFKDSNGIVIGQGGHVSSSTTTYTVQYNYGATGSVVLAKLAPGTLDWTGADAGNPGKTDNWNDPLNWLQNARPQSGDTLVFDSSAATIASFASVDDRSGLNNITLQINPQSPDTAAFSLTEKTPGLFPTGDDVGLSQTNGITVTFGAAATKSPTVAINFILTGGSMTPIVVTGPSTDSLTLSGILSNDGSSNASLSVNAGAQTGELILSGANTYAGTTGTLGTTAVGGGILNVQNDLALSGTLNGVMPAAQATVAPGATLQLQNNITIDNPLSIAGGGATVNGTPIGALDNASGNNTVSGSVTLTFTPLPPPPNTSIGIGADSGTLFITGVINDGGNALGVTKVGAGTVELQATNTWTGATTVNAGTLGLDDLAGIINGVVQSAIASGSGALTIGITNGTNSATVNVEANQQIPTNVPVTITNRGTLNLVGASSDTINTLTNSGTITIGTGTLGIANSGTSTGTISGTGNVDVNGVAGTLDSTFNDLTYTAALSKTQTALGTTSLGFDTHGIIAQGETNSVTGTAVAVETSGEIVVGGSNNGVGLLLGYLANGTQDGGFDTNAQAAVATAGFTNITGIYIVPTTATVGGGDIIVIGNAGNQYVVAALTNTGTLDTSTTSNFNNKTGFVKAPFLPGTSPDMANAVTVQPDGAIVVVGTATLGASKEVFVARYLFQTANGLDTSFGINGTLTISGSNPKQGNAVALLTAGTNLDIVIGGQDATQAAVWWVTPTGNLDTSFGSGTGEFVGTISGQSLSGIAIQTNAGVQQVVGVGNLAGSGFVMRLLNTGSGLDTTFGINGLVTFSSLIPAGSSANAVAVQVVTSGLNVGDILVAGTTNLAATSLTKDLTGDNNFYVARLLPGGSFDTSFGPDQSGTPFFNTGVSIIDFNRGQDTAGAMALQTTGEIVVAGTTLPVNGSPGAVALTELYDTAASVIPQVTVNSTANTYTGQTVVDGDLILNGSLPATSAVTVGAVDTTLYSPQLLRGPVTSGVLTLNSTDSTFPIASLSGSGLVELGSNTLQIVGDPNANTVFFGVLDDGGKVGGVTLGSVSNGTSFTSGGTLTYAGPLPNQYSGTTAILDGTLQLDKSLCCGFTLPSYSLPGSPPDQDAIIGNLQVGSDLVSRQQAQANVVLLANNQITSGTVTVSGHAFQPLVNISTNGVFTFGGFRDGNDSTLFNTRVFANPTNASLNNDANFGSLRDALLTANALTTGLGTQMPATITFNNASTTGSNSGSNNNLNPQILATGGFTALTSNLFIQVGSLLGASGSSLLHAALPTPIEQVQIGDGSRSPLVTVDGSNVDGSNGVNGLVLTVSTSTIQNLNVQNFTHGDGILIGNLASGAANTGDQVLNDVSNSNLAGVVVNPGNNSTNLSGNTINGNATEGVFLNSTSSNTLTGNTINSNTDGVQATSSPNNTFTGNTISNNAADGVFFNGSANNSLGGTSTGTGNTVSGSAIGVLVQGTASTGNVIQNDLVTGNSTDGVVLNGASGNLVGAGNRAIGDTITNNGVGLLVENGANSNTVEGNSITNNPGVGVELFAAGGNTLGALSRTDGNVVSANGTGVLLENNANGNTVEGNLIGTDAAGTAGNGNAGAGVSIVNSTGNLIGGGSDQGNVISANKQQGLLLNGAGSNTVEGNLIGSDATETLSLGNSADGVLLVNASNANTFVSNFIGANAGSGIVVDPSNNNVIQGNQIGVNASGTALGNGAFGILINAGQNNVIGGLGAANAAFPNLKVGPGNSIAFNGQYGVEVAGTSQGNQILSNDIYSNGLTLVQNVISKSGGANVNNASGILLQAGTTSNNQQPAPTLNVITPDLIQGTLKAAPNTSYLLQFFLNLPSDAEGVVTVTFTIKGTSSLVTSTVVGSSAEGRIYQVALDLPVTTGVSGSIPFTMTLTGNKVLTAGDYLTATATDEFGNTSEFSFGIQVTNNPRQQITPLDFNTSVLQNLVGQGASRATAPFFVPFFVVGDLTPISDATFGGGFTQPLTADPNNGGDIQGFVFEDLNRTGKFDENPASLMRGQQIYLERPNAAGQFADISLFSDAFRSETTNDKGIFLFKDVPAGTYRIHRQAPDGDPFAPVEKDGFIEVKVIRRAETPDGNNSVKGQPFGVYNVNKPTQRRPGPKGELPKQRPAEAVSETPAPMQELPVVIVPMPAPIVPPPAERTATPAGRAPRTREPLTWSHWLLAGLAGFALTASTKPKRRSDPQRRRLQGPEELPQR